MRANLVANECKKEFSQQDKRTRLCLEAVICDINEYLTNRRGKSERVVERIIDAVINCKHNPFYGGSFNGNDCFRLLEGYALLFEALRAASEHESKESKDALEDVAMRHEQIFKLFGLLVGLTKVSARSSWKESRSSGKHTSVYRRVR
jgi:hypothetical protein